MDGWTQPARLDIRPLFGYNNVRGYAPVAQLDRVSDSDSEGHAFESHRAYQKTP